MDNLTSPYKGPISTQIFMTAVSDGMPVQLARWMVGQSRYETGQYTNKHFVLHLACFSYMYSKGSKWQVPGGGTLADNGAPVGKYKTIADSVHEITDWIKRRQKEGRFPADLNQIKSPMEYAALLQKCGFYQGWKKFTPQQNLEFYAAGIEKGAANPM